MGSRVSSPNYLTRNKRIMSNLSHRPAHIDGNLGHRPSHIDGNLSHRPSHADVKYMKKSSDEKESSFPNNFWFPEPAANISTEKKIKENPQKQEEKEENKTDINNNSQS